jgi:GDPmannose 4,6-dehydratase
MKEVRFYQASSSEMFGLPKESPQNEKTLLHPRSPYGVSKVAAHHLVVNYRESYGFFASTGILFNHESPLRSPSFVTRKITKGVASIAKGLSDSITLGNLEVSRDWGWAPDYVEGMISILEHDQPDDFVLATGVSRSLKEFMSTAFNAIGVSDWEAKVKSDDSLFRPAEVVSVVGDASKARRILGWQPSESFEGMVKKMVQFDLDLMENKTAAMDWRPE